MLVKMEKNNVSLELNIYFMNTAKCSDFFPSIQ